MMRNYWYTPLANEHPRTTDGYSVRVVRPIQIKGKYSIIRMGREATPKETGKCKLLYCGHGYREDEYIRRSIRKCLS